MTAAVLDRPKATRGTSNSNARGSSLTRKRRREWLVATYRANVDLIQVTWSWGDVSVDSYCVSIERLLEFDAVLEAVAVPAARCYRCGTLLSVDTVTVDRIIPGCKGGTYRRDNIRPACGGCNSETGGALRGNPKRALTAVGA